jgi:hypothetical protein
LQERGVDARALVGGLAKWYQETGKLERGK